MLRASHSSTALAIEKDKSEDFIPSTDPSGGGNWPIRRRKVTATFRCDSGLLVRDAVRIDTPSGSGTCCSHCLALVVIVGGPWILRSATAATSQKLVFCISSTSQEIVGPMVPAL